jgi:hypothetical protein
MDDEVIRILQLPTCTVEEWRTLLFPLSKNSAYSAIERGEVESIRIGGRIRIVTAPWRRKLGLDEQAAA